MQTQTDIKQEKKVDFAKVAVKYAKDVLSDKIVACDALKLACKRFQKDLEDKRWKFDKDEVGKACRFIQLLPHVKGFTGKIKLEPWQIFYIANVVGFKDPETGYRKYARAIAFVARGNGKSTLIAGLAIYLTFFCGEPGSDGYALATTREQAKIVWQTAQAMLRGLPELCKKAGIDVAQQAIFQVSTNSSFKALSSDYGTLDGLLPQVAVIDELHEIQRGLYDIIETSLQKRDQPILLSISTAGFDTSSIGHELYAYGKSILEGIRDDDRFFILIFESDTDDVLDEEGWKQANPNLGISVRTAAMRADAKKAATLASFRNGFLTKHMNRWVNSREAWMRMDKWNDCTDKTLKLSDYASKPVVVGLDMSNRNDITSKCYVFTDERDGKLHYTAFWNNYLPELVVQESRNASYAGWVADGYITTTPGDSIDYAQVENELIEDSHTFPQMEVCSDPWNTVQLAQNLTAHGIQTIEVRPTVKNFSPALKELQDAVLSGRFHHDGNPAVAWAVGNITVKPDAAGNIYPAKTTGNAKIDPGVALVIAITKAMLANPTSGPLVIRWL